MLDEFVLVRLELKVFWTARQLKSIETMKVGLIKSIYIFKINIGGWTKSVRKTVKFVASQKLLVKEQILGSVTNRALLTVLYFLL